jgi:hypothetical protein
MINKKTSAAVIVAAIGTLSVGACGHEWEDWEYEPRGGTVTELEYEPSSSYEECGNEQVYNATTGKYTTKYDCDTVYEDECYEVDFRTPEGDLLEECTTEEVFEGLVVGAVYIEGMDELATHTPWLTPSPSPSVSTSPSPSASASAG